MKWVNGEKSAAVHIRRATCLPQDIPFFNTIGYGTTISYPIDWRAVFLEKTYNAQATPIIKRDPLRYVTENNSTPDILLVEDNPGDVRLTQIAFQDAGFDVGMHVATDGVEAMDFLEDEESPCPDFILLDLNLPRKDGFDVLEEIRSDSELAHLPVLVLTSSTATEDVILSYEQYANAYLTKPDNPESFGELIQSIMEFWVEKANLPSCS